MKVWVLYLEYVQKIRNLKIRERNVKRVIKMKIIRI